MQKKKNKTLGGCLCLAALLWTIWLVWNEYTYKDTRIKFLQIEFLLKHRAYCWAKAMKLVHEDHYAIWAVNPLQAFRTHRILNLKLILNNWFKVSHHVAFIDGSYKKKAVGPPKAGIGGFMMNSNGALVFLFSGPTIHNSSIEAERAALMFLLNSVAANKDKYSSKLTIFTDAKNFVKQFYREINGQNRSPLGLLVSNSFKNLNLIHLERSLNYSADSLARSGSQRNKIVAG